MANGMSGHETVEHVKSTCNGLECSPSKSSPQSPIAHGGTRATGHGAKGTTSKLNHGTTRGKPRGTKTDMGKKSHSFKKSSGR